MAVGKPFVKGQSGNPGGRARGLERRVRELLKGDIDAMTLAMRDIALGTPPAEGPLASVAIKTRDRIEAYKVLTDRGWGKPKQIVDMNHGAQPLLTEDQAKILADLTEEQLEGLATLDADAGGSPDDDDGDQGDAG